ncbi:MAG: hypothetical protein Q9183_007165 [Haloplaca sp. 2 TL-2023]
MVERQEKMERRRAKRILEKGGDDDGVNEGEGEQAPTEKEPNGILTDPRFAKLFQDPDFAIDETSKEFKMLNPSTKPVTEDRDGPERRLTAVEEEALDPKVGSDSDKTDSGSSEDEPDVKAKDAGRVSSSSYKKSGHRPQQPQIRVSSSKVPHRAKDRSFGDRAERVKVSRPSEATVVGEREITFAPERKTKGAKKAEKPERQRKEGRRSASGNVFRKM